MGGFGTCNIISNVSIQTGKKFVLHIDHQRSSWDMFYRSAVSYQEMARYADFIKPILYHDIFGPRLRNWLVGRWKNHMYKELSEEQILNYYYSTFNLNPQVEPSLDELNGKGLSPDYVYREINRFLSDPDILYEATMKSFEAGARGVLASRDYDEMRLSSIEAFGNAVRDWKARHVR